MIEDDKRLSDIEATLTKLTRRVDRGLADIGRLIAERHETDEIARLHAEIHWRDQEIASLRASTGDSGQAIVDSNSDQVVVSSGRSNSIPKVYARARRKVLARLSANESARRVMSRLPSSMQGVLRAAAPPSVAAAFSIEAVSSANVLDPFDPHRSRSSDLAGNGRISIERLCLIAQEVSDAREARI